MPGIAARLGHVVMPLDGADVVALSDDDDDGGFLAAARAEIDERRPRGKSLNDEKRAAGGGKRSKKFIPPLPPGWQKTATGYQQYRLPKERRVYERLYPGFDFSDQYKLGRE